MTAKKASAAYATNVRHYRHVLEGLRQEFDDVDFIGPTEIDSTVLDRLNGLLPSTLTRVLERRAAPALPDTIRRVGSTHTANLPSLKRLLIGRSVTARQVVQIHSLQARQVRRLFSGSNYLQTVEGLAHEALRRRSAETIIVERRNLHHEVFETPLQTYADFPFRPRLDPIRDLLLEEYEHADRVVVYSNVAKQSFLERGVPAERIWTSPLPVQIGSRRDKAARVRDPFQLLYVGRLDAYKGIDVAVAATEALGPHWKLVVAGPGGKAERDWLTKRKQVVYHGVLNKSELSELFDTSAALLSPSIESFGLAVLEATRAGIPVLLRETTGVKDYLPMNAARVVPTRDPQVWSAAIEDGFAGLGNAWTNKTSSLLQHEAAVANQARLIRDIYHSSQRGPS